MSIDQSRADNTKLAATVTAASRAADKWAAPAGQPECPNTTLISRRDPRYPSMLQTIDDPPQYLYVRGSLSPGGDASALAIVGSRKATPQGVQAAETLAGSLASMGHTIVSGLADGVDAAAHRGALAAHGRTVAVIGTGIDRIYPASNVRLRDQIAEHGAVISQFALGQPPSKTTFPARNVLIAGLTRASLLIELTERSGTRIEATIAREQGKPVLLWEPLLGHLPWAREYASQPLVHFVGSPGSVAEALTRDVVAR